MIDYKNVIFKEMHVKQLTAGANARISIGTVSYPWSLKVLESTGAIGFYADALSGTARFYVNPDGSVIAGNATSTGSTSIANVGTLDLRYSSVSHTHTFASLTSKPTTLAGYGITDAMTNNTTETVTGDKTFSGTTKIQNIVFSGTNEINSSTGFYMQYNTNGNVSCNGGSSTGNLISNNFTKLGSTAPSIKMKKLTGSTGAVGSTTSIAHGIADYTKILAIDVLVASLYLPNDPTPANNFYVRYGATNVDVILGASATTIATSKSIKVLITYEE